MRPTILAITFVSALLAFTTSDSSQTSRAADEVIAKIWAEATGRSEAYSLAQELLDAIGPRVTGSPEQKRANDWATAVYAKWGIPARAEQYGTWKAWRRGTLHIDLIAPRIRSLEGKMFTWSLGTKGPVEGAAILFPNVTSAAQFEEWLPQVRGKFVLLAPPEPTCRPDENWKAFATSESFERMRSERAAARDAWQARFRATGLRGHDILGRLGDAGTFGVLTSLWPQGWGVSKTGSAVTQKVPELDLSCEDYGLVFRLAENNQGPVLRMNADAQFLGEVEVSNVIAELRGKEKPHEYVVLSAHFDSWDAASGATDNGASSVAVMEAMRILKVVHPNPKRTILAGLWSGEEQGFNGSRAFAADYPEVVKGMQALFNHDAGTGRVSSVSLQGFAGAGGLLRNWLSHMPDAMTREISLVDPGTPERGTDAASFICHGAPGFHLSSVGWDYHTYTWHTNRDTFDKLVFDDLKNNAMVFAILAYLASEDAERVPREPRVTPTDPKTGKPAPWPTCTPPARTSAQVSGQ